MGKTKNNILKLVKIFGIDYQLNVIYKYIKKPYLNCKDKKIEIWLPNKYKKINNEIIIELI